MFWHPYSRYVGKTAPSAQQLLSIPKVYDAGCHKAVCKVGNSSTQPDHPRNCLYGQRLLRPTTEMAREFSFPKLVAGTSVCAARGRSNWGGPLCPCPTEKYKLGQRGSGVSK